MVNLSKKMAYRPQYIFVGAKGTAFGKVKWDGDLMKMRKGE
jgi:hypothetical protein